MISITNEIKKRIDNYEEGTIFLTASFSDLATNTTIRKCLGRLTDAGIINRLFDGIYEKPKYSKFLNEYIPANPEKVAKAIADNYHWNIAPCDDLVLNYFGLSTQIPIVWTYISDGPYRIYQYDNIKISFKHRTNRNISKLSNITIMVIEVFRAIGKEHVDEKTIKILKNKLSKEDKAIIIKEAINSPEWIYKNIRKVCVE